MLNVTKSQNYSGDLTLEKIESCIFKQLTELTFVDSNKVRYTNTVAVIRKYCRNLTKLHLGVESNEEDITAIVNNNPHLVDIYVSLGGGYHGVSIVSFLEFLIATRSSIKSLSLHDY